MKLYDDQAHMYPTVPAYASALIPDKFEVVCDATNNSPEDAKQGIIKASITLHYKRIPITRGGST